MAVLLASISNHSLCSLPQPSQERFICWADNSRWISLSIRAMRGAFWVGEGLESRDGRGLVPGVVREEDPSLSDAVVVVVVVGSGGCDGDGDVDDFLVGLG